MPESQLSDATIVVVDVETTGTDPTHDAVVEVACSVIRSGREVRSFTSLVNPGIAIPPRASAVHHLRDEDVRTEPSLADVSPVIELLAPAPWSSRTTPRSIAPFPRCSPRRRGSAPCA